MDEVYRGYRIAIRTRENIQARITHVRGPPIPLTATATLSEGVEKCAIRARAEIDRYIAFLEQSGPDA